MPGHKKAKKYWRVLLISVAFAMMSSFFVSSTAYAQCPKIEGLPENAKQPSLSIPIPNLSFNCITVTQNGEKKIIDVPFLADYIAAVYKYAVGIAAVIAAVMMMVGGFQYLTAGGDSGRVSAGKERINDALIGLALSLGTYVILFTVNPDLVSLKGLKIQQVQTIPFLQPDENETEEVSGSLATSFKKPKGDNITGPGLAKIPADLAVDIEAVASELRAKGYGFYVASSFRSPQEQTNIIKSHCKNPPGSKTCDPLPGKSVACMMVGGNPANCAHTTGHALDIWATKKSEDGKSYARCIKEQKVCLENMQSCFDDECQKELIENMKNAGFCVLSSEAWHFEKPKMSKNCQN